MGCLPLSLVNNNWRMTQALQHLLVLDAALYSSATWLKTYLASACCTSQSGVTSNMTNIGISWGNNRYCVIGLQLRAWKTEHTNSCILLLQIARPYGVHWPFRLSVLVSACGPLFSSLSRHLQQVRSSTRATQYHLDMLLLLTTQVTIEKSALTAVHCIY